MMKDILDNTRMSEIKNYLSHLAKTYHSSYQAPRSKLRKYCILQKLKGNKAIVILRPDEGSSVAVLNWSD